MYDTNYQANLLLDNLMQHNHNMNNQPYIHVNVFQSSDLLRYKDVKQQSDFIKIEGDAIETINNIITYITNKSNLTSEDTTTFSNHMPLILEGCTYMCINKEDLQETKPQDNMHFLLKHKVDGDRLVVGIYVKDYFKSIYIANEGMTSYSYFKLGTASCPVENLQGDMKFDLTSSLDIKLLGIESYEVHKAPQGLVFSQPRPFYLKPVSGKRIDRLAKRLCDEDIERANYLIAEVFGIFTIYCSTLNALKALYVKEKARLRAEQLPTPNSAQVTRIKHSPTAKQLQPTSQDNIITLGIAQIENLSAIEKFFKDIDHKIKRTVSYTVDHWQVAGYYQRLRNGKLQYFPPSIRYRRAEEFMLPTVKRTKSYTVKGD